MPWAYKARADMSLTPTSSPGDGDFGFPTVRAPTDLNLLQCDMGQTTSRVLIILPLGIHRLPTDYTLHVLVLSCACPPLRATSFLSYRMLRVIALGLQPRRHTP